MLKGSIKHITVMNKHLLASERFKKIQLFIVLHICSLPGFKYQSNRIILVRQRSKFLVVFS